MTLNPYQPKIAISIFVLMGLFLGLLLYLPANFFDQGQSVCLSVVFFDMECYACGMTRGVMHFIHGDFQAAWEFNKLVFVVVPLVAFLIGKHAYDVFVKGQREPKPRQKRKLFSKRKPTE